MYYGRQRMNFNPKLQPACSQEKSHSSVDVLKRIRYPPTMLAATRLSAMLNGNDEVYVNSMVVDEVNDSDVNFTHLNTGADVSYHDQSDSTPISERSLRDAGLPPCASPEMVSGDSPSRSLTSRLSLSGGTSRLCRTLGYGIERDAAYSSVKKRSVRYAHCHNFHVFPMPCWQLLLYERSRGATYYSDEYAAPPLWEVEPHIHHCNVRHHVTAHTGRAATLREWKRRGSWRTLLERRNEWGFSTTSWGDSAYSSAVSCTAHGLYTDSIVCEAPPSFSSSLDGLDADSEGEGTYSRYQSPESPAQEDSSGFLGNSADELDSSEAITERDFQNRQAGTLPLLQSKPRKGQRPGACTLQYFVCPQQGRSKYACAGAVAEDQKRTSCNEDGRRRSGPETPIRPDQQRDRPWDPLSSGLRFRSYSYSSPKNFLGKQRLTRDLSIGEPGDERAFSFPDQSREKRIEEEEWDRYMTPAKPECEKNKVSRTFSFLRSRMSSTRNKNKDKVLLFALFDSSISFFSKKSKIKESKEKVSRHQFVPGTFSGVVPCLVCEKALLGKESFQCSNCNVNIHKACKDGAPACSKVSAKMNIVQGVTPTK
ncbi:unnamed protein product [Ranitomeya imitator]|uniref:Phorbol-ester/DAG-type domain-containing protein n=1 Tax=Ranitomeya imitator TaxID=111125 RepID=A0ABN9KXT1_9NEOB|nr:unnamed protein product [Ranitomeya imitator]